jgi:uridine phosphorylase
MTRKKKRTARNRNASSQLQLGFIPRDRRLVIKEPLPRCGLISSNPERVEIIKESLCNCTTFVNNWGIKIYTGEYNGLSLFVSSVALGSAGAAFAVRQMFSSGAECILRYGSNDYHVENFDDASMQRITLVTMTDNLRGVMYECGEPKKLIGGPITGSESLLRSVRETAESQGVQVTEAVCHNTDDYYATNTPQFFSNYQRISDRRKALEKNPLYRTLAHCEDMESAALFYVASRMGKHAASVLQTIIKVGDEHVYESQKGRKAVALMHETFLPLVFSALERWNLENPIKDEVSSKI